MGMTTFVLAVGGVSLVCYLLMTRAQNITRAQNLGAQRRGSAGDGSLSPGSYDSAGGSGIFGWFGGDGSPSANSDASCGSGGDSGGGGGSDGGGGGE